MFAKRILIALALMLLGCQQSATETEWQKAPIPNIPPMATVRLRVVHAINPRLPHLSPEEIRVVLASAQLTAWKHFHVNLEFTDVPEIGIDKLFALIPPSVRDARKQSIYDFKTGNGDRRKLAEGIETTLTERGTKLEDALAFARPYLPPDAHPKDIAELSTMLTNVTLERMEQWHELKAADGEPVLDASPYNEWVYWDTLGYGDLPYDLVITNQLIDSAEYYGADVHSALRGGVTVGTTSYSRTAPYSAYIFMSTFPFTDNSPVSLRMRGGEQYSEVDAAELVGAYLTHEIGHLLFQFGHPFGQTSCIMNPASMLHFREWYNQINTTDCAMGSRPEMKVGNIPQYYNPDWVRMAEHPHPANQ